MSKEIIKIDHEVLAISRLATEYKDSVNLIAYIRALIHEANTLEEVFIDIVRSRSIDKAEGVNLDIIGSIVGQSRRLVEADLFSYFGFYDNPQANPFGTVRDLSEGGRFRRIGEVITGFRELYDEEYRLFIRGRIASNMTRSTPEEIISQISFILGDTSPVFILEGPARYQISVGRELTPTESVLVRTLSIVPKTAGVEVLYGSEFEGEDFFAFSGVNYAKGFGSIHNLELGGKFARLIT